MTASENPHLKRNSIPALVFNALSLHLRKKNDAPGSGRPSVQKFFRAPLKMHLGHEQAL